MTVRLLRTRCPITVTFIAIDIVFCYVIIHYDMLMCCVSRVENQLLTSPPTLLFLPVFVQAALRQSAHFAKPVVFPLSSGEYYFRYSFLKPVENCHPLLVHLLRNILQADALQPNPCQDFVIVHPR